MRELRYKDLPIYSYQSFNAAVHEFAKKGPFTLILTEDDVNQTENPNLSDVKYSLTAVQCAHKVVYKDKILKDKNGYILIN